uniref:Ig-like domain-containing protein n=1 Tax=Monopterus albus TaxID=43700 RepID=A0A3Q3J5Q6_MONAL
QIENTFVDMCGIMYFPSDPVRPGDLVTLQCSVLFDNKTCLQEHSVYWFRARSDDSHPSVIYAHLNSGDHCERSPEISSSQKCVYNLSRNVSSSDAGTYYCAVATCGEILFGSGTKLEVEGNHLILSHEAATLNNDVILLVFNLSFVPFPNVSAADMWSFIGIATYTQKILSDVCLMLVYYDIIWHECSFIVSIWIRAIHLLAFNCLFYLKHFLSS